MGTLEHRDTVLDAEGLRLRGRGSHMSQVYGEPKRGGGPLGSSRKTPSDKGGDGVWSELLRQLRGISRYSLPSVI